MVSPSLCNVNTEIFDRANTRLGRYSDLIYHSQSSKYALMVPLALFAEIAAMILQPSGRFSRNAVHYGYDANGDQAMFSSEDFKLQGLSFPLLTFWANLPVILPLRRIVASS